MANECTPTPQARSCEELELPQCVERLKKLDDQSMQQIVDWAGRQDIVKAGKHLNTAFIMWREASNILSNSMDLQELDGMAQKAGDVRDQCRLFVAVRAGFTILLQRSKGQVSGYSDECKELRVVVPKKLKAALDSLADNQDQDNQGGAAPMPMEGEEGATLAEEAAAD